MDDTELIDFASKASGFAYSGAANPLIDDALALRLAVKLRITVELTARTVMAQEDGTSGTEAILDLLGDDPCAATRRAIVRAAAAIGKAMK